MRDENLNDAVSSMLIACCGSPVLLTGSLAETILGSCVLPARVVGPHTAFRIMSLWTCTNNANVKNVRHRLNGVAVGSALNLATYGNAQLMMWGANRGAINSQVWNSAVQAPFAQGSAALNTSAADFAQDVTLDLTAGLGNAGDTITLEAWWVEILAGATQ